MKSSSNHKMRILHVVHSLDIGGLERVVVDLALGFRHKGHYVGVCCLSSKGALSKELVRSDVPVFSLEKRPGIDLRIPMQLSKKMRQHQFDVVHTHNEAGLIYGTTAAIFARIPRIIYTEHGKGLGYHDRKLFRIVERYLIKKTNKVVAVSEDLRAKMINWHRLERNRFFVIPNGIDVDEFKEKNFRKKKRDEVGLKDDDFVIGIVASLLPIKNHCFFLTVFKKLLMEFPKLKLVLIGDGPLRGYLEDRVLKMEVSKKVIILGARLDVPALLSALDMYVLPSLSEGISISILEAMAAGIPIVASDVGGNSQIIKDAHSGFLVPVGNEEAWIKTLRELLNHPRLRKTISHIAQQTVENRFSLACAINQYESIYTA